MASFPCMAISHHPSAASDGAARRRCQNTLAQESGQSGPRSPGRQLTGNRPDLGLVGLYLGPVALSTSGMKTQGKLRFGSMPAEKSANPRPWLDAQNCQDLVDTEPHSLLQSFGVHHDAA